MKFKVTTKDPIEARQLAKASDMASFIWELVNNGWREFKHTDYDYGPAWDKINSLLDEHGIVIDDIYQ